MRRLIACRVGAWSSTMRILGRFLSVSVMGLAAGNISSASSGAIFKSRDLRFSTMGANPFCRIVGPPDGVGVEQLVRAEGGFVVHCAACADPVPEVVVRDVVLSRELDFPQRAERAERAARFGGIEIKINSAERVGRTEIAEPDAEQSAGAV